MNIVITGTPGTGKTTIAKALGKRLGLPVVHINDYAKDRHLIVGKSGGSSIVDIAKLRKLLLGESGIIEGHLACEFGLPATKVIVLRRDPRLLLGQYKRKRYPRQKQRDNLECEALDYCSLVAEKHYGQKNVFDVDTSKRTVRETVDKIISIVHGKSSADRVDFSAFLLR